MSPSTLRGDHSGSCTLLLEEVGSHYGKEGEGRERGGRGEGEGRERGGRGEGEGRERGGRGEGEGRERGGRGEGEGRERRGRGEVWMNGGRRGGRKGSME